MWRIIFSSLLIVYEGCEESSSVLSDDYCFHRSSCSNVSLYRPMMGCPVADDIDMDTLSITNDGNEADNDTQSLSTSPLSIDSGLECLEGMESSATSCVHVRHYRRYECDNSTDSTDSGVVSGFGQDKRCSGATEDSSEDSESDDIRAPTHLSAPAAAHFDEEAVDHVLHRPTDDDGELTPVLENRLDDFMQHQEEADDDQQVKRRRVDSNSCELVDVRMIDFAHTTFSGYLGDEQVHWGPDEGYLLGLGSLTKILNEIRLIAA